MKRWATLNGPLQTTQCICGPSYPLASLVPGLCLLSVCVITEGTRLSGTDDEGLLQTRTNGSGRDPSALQAIERY